MNNIKPILGDANSLIKEIEDNSIDLIATDPPYEINFENNDWDKPEFLNWEYFAEEFKRVLKPAGNLIVFQGWSHVINTSLELKALRPKWWVIHLITPSGYKSRPPKWK